MRIHFSVIIVAVVCLLSCKKDSPYSNLANNKLVAAFRAESLCITRNPGVLNFVDSTIVFTNNSYLQDSTLVNNLKISFKWIFGDATTSTETNTTHKYHFPGTYHPKLITYLEDQPSDSAIFTLQIKMGQREYNLSPNTRGIDIEEAAGNEIITLYREQSLSVIRTYGLLKTDSILHVIWVKRIPGDDTKVRLNSIKRNTDNSYILSGNYNEGNTEQFCLSKIDSSGNLLWMKYIDSINGRNTVTVPSADGGFITGGNKVNIDNSLVLTLVKCDANGDELWRKTFDPAMALAGILNIISTDTGFVFASTSFAGNPQIVLTRLNLNGNITGQIILGPANPSNYSLSGVLSVNNGFVIYNNSVGYIYFVNSDFTLMKGQPAAGVVGWYSGGDSFGYYYSDGQYSTIAQYAADGSGQWEYLIDPVNYIDCNSFTDGVSRNVEKVIHTSNHEIVVLSDGSNVVNGWSLYLNKLTTGGELK